MQWPITDFKTCPHRQLRSSFCVTVKVCRTSIGDRRLPQSLSKNNQDPPYFWSKMYALSWQLSLWTSVFTPDVQHKYRSNKKETHDQNWNRPTKNKEKKYINTKPKNSALSKGQSLLAKQTHQFICNWKRKFLLHSHRNIIKYTEMRQSPFIKQMLLLLCFKRQLHNN